MTSDLSLYFAATLISFFLQVAAGYIACSLLSRLLSRPRQRFAVWMAFLSASGLYWIALAAWSAQRAFHPAAGDLGPDGGASRSSYVVPLAWSSSILKASEVCLVVYAVVLVLLTAFSVWSRVRLRLVLRHGRPAPDSWLPLFETACRDLGVSRCRLMILPGISSPSTVGWLRPRILLPSVCEEIGQTPRLAHVLQHELAHVARRDYLWAGLSELFCHILFFHPAAWHAKKLMLLERELACDSSVVEACPDRRADYADSLAYFVRRRLLEEKAAVGLDFAASASNLGKRVRFILAGPRSLPWWNRASRAAIGLALMGALAVALPAITVILAFAKPAPASAVPLAAAGTISHPAKRKVHGSNAVANSAPVQEISRIGAAGYIRETSAYALLPGSEGAGSREPGTLQRPWGEIDSSQNHRTVSDVVRDTVTILRPSSDHDHDRDRNPRLSHSH